MATDAETIMLCSPVSINDLIIDQSKLVSIIIHQPAVVRTCRRMEVTLHALSVERGHGLVFRVRGFDRLTDDIHRPPIVTASRQCTNRLLTPRSLWYANIVVHS